MSRLTCTFPKIVISLWSERSTRLNMLQQGSTASPTMPTVANEAPYAHRNDLKADRSRLKTVPHMNGIGPARGVDSELRCKCAAGSQDYLQEVRRQNKKSQIVNFRAPPGSS